jgi:hypothetical protein
MGGIVVENDVDRLAGRDLALDSIEKGDEFEVAVALHADALPRRTEANHEFRFLPVDAVGHAIGFRPGLHDLEPEAATRLVRVIVGVAVMLRLDPLFAIGVWLQFLDNLAGEHQFFLFADTARIRLTLPVDRGYRGYTLCGHNALGFWCLRGKRYPCQRP